MGSALRETLETLKTSAARTKKILVSYSDGKDSRAVLDLCLRSFDHVEGFFMYFIPGLVCMEEALAKAERDHGIKIHRYPHWLARKCIVEGVYCNNHVDFDDLPEWKLRDIYDLVIHETKIPLIATGAKRADSTWRRRMLTSVSSYDDVMYPIAGWTKLDVLAYLKTRGIAIPSSSAGSATGIDLSTPSLLWLHDTYPDDFRRLCEFFPYAEAVVWRRTWHGVI